MTQRFQCSHIRKTQHAPIVTCAMKTIPGAPTRADELDTLTELCMLCAGRMVAALVQLERDGDFPRASTVVRP